MSKMETISKYDRQVLDDLRIAIERAIQRAESGNLAESLGEWVKNIYGDITDWHVEHGSAD